MPARTSFVGSILVGLGVDSRRVVTGTKPATAATKQYRQALRQLRGEFYRVRRASRRFVNDFVRNASITLAAAFGIARLVSQFLKLDRALVRQRSLVGLSTKEVARFRQEIIRLAPALGQSPADLAEGLFFVTSAGFRGAEALDVLRASAMASAIGLGEVEQVATGVTRTVQAYRQANLSAAQAAAVLVATVREGNLEAATLIPQFSRLAAITAELGIPVHDLGAAMASLSRTQGPEQAGTALLGLVKPLLKPTTQLTTALDAMQTSFGQLHTSIRERGLFETLQNLRRLTAEYNVNLGDLFRDQYGIIGLLSLTGANFESTNAIAERLSNTVENDLTRAFQIASESIEFQFNQALSSLERIGLGAVQQVLPGLVKNLGDIVTVLAGLILLIPVFKALRVFGSVLGALGARLLGAEKATRNLRKAFVDLFKTLTGIGVAGGIAFSFRDDINQALDPGRVADLDRQRFQEQTQALANAVREREQILQNLRDRQAQLQEELDITNILRGDAVAGGGVTIEGFQLADLDQTKKQLQEALFPLELEIVYAERGVERARRFLQQFQRSLAQDRSRPTPEQVSQSSLEAFEAASQEYKQSLAQLKNLQRETGRLQKIQDRVQMGLNNFVRSASTRRASLLGDPAELERSQFVYQQVQTVQAELLRIDRDRQKAQKELSRIETERAKLGDEVRRNFEAAESATDLREKVRLEGLERDARARQNAFEQENKPIEEQARQSIPALIKAYALLLAYLNELETNLNSSTDALVRQNQIIEQVTKSTQQQIALERARADASREVNDFRKQQNQSIQDTLAQLEFERTLIGKSNAEREAATILYRQQAEEQARLRDASIGLNEAQIQLEQQNLRLQQAEAAYHELLNQTGPLTQEQQEILLRLETVYSQIRQEHERAVPALEAEIARYEELVKQLVATGLTAEEARRLLEQLRMEISKNEEIEEAQKRWEEAAKQIGQSFGNALEGIILEGQKATDVIKQLAVEIIKAVIQAAFIQPLIESITGGGGFLAGLGGLFAAQGGYRRGLTVVGELGPELVDFRQPARVYTNQQLQGALSGGGGSTLVQTFNIQSTDGPGVRAAIREATPSIVEASKQAVAQDTTRPSAFQKTMRTYI